MVIGNYGSYGNYHLDNPVEVRSSMKHCHEPHLHFVRQRPSTGEGDAGVEAVVVRRWHAQYLVAPAHVLGNVQDISEMNNILLVRRINMYVNIYLFIPYMAKHPSLYNSTYEIIDHLYKESLYLDNHTGYTDLM